MRPFPFPHRPSPQSLHDLLTLLLLLSTSLPLPAATPAASNPSQRYIIWERVRIMDQNGFQAPVEAYSILLPKGWKTQGAIKWVINVACPAETIQNRLTATSPDGRFKLEVFPVQSWQWFDDPMMLQIQRNNANLGSAGCPLLQPFDAAQYLEKSFLPTDLPGATLVRHERNQPMTQLMMEQARKDNAFYQANAVPVENRPSAEIGHVRWPDGRIGVAFCAVAQTVSFMPNLLQGGTYAAYQCQATVKTVLSGPQGSESEINSLLGTIVASTRVNPEWQASVQRVFSNIAKVEQQETAKRAAMWRQTQNEISQIQRRSWEDSQASRDRIHEEWGKVIRGIDTWVEPGGGKVELNSGYSHAWSKSDGTYLLSNDPLFDPRVELKEDWKKLEKKP